MPHDLRSLTRRTLLMTSRPRLSKTKTFHTGSPSTPKMGVDCCRSPLACDSSCAPSKLRGGTLLRFKIFLIAASQQSQHRNFVAQRRHPCTGLTNLTVSETLMDACHCKLLVLSERIFNAATVIFVHQYSYVP